MPPLPLIMQQQHSASVQSLALCSQLSSFNWSIWYSLHLSYYPLFLTSHQLSVCRCITWGANPPASLAWARSNGRKSTNKHLKVETGGMKCKYENMWILKWAWCRWSMRVSMTTSPSRWCYTIPGIYISTISLYLHIYNIYAPAQARPPRPQPHLLGHQPRAARPPRAGGLPQPRDLLWVLGRIKYILDRVAKFQA